MTEITITSADGTRLAARHTGAGTPIVLVHGSLGSIDSFALTEPLLAERHAVWTYSWRAHGRSAAAADLSLDRQIEDLLAVIEAAGGDVHLCGWSTGAVYAIAAAQHVTAARSLILYEPPLKLDDELALTMHGVLTQALEIGGPDLALERFFPYASVTADEAAILRAQAEVWEQLRDGVRVLPRELRALIDTTRTHDSGDERALRTLYLCGQHSQSPSFLTAPEVAAVFPHAEVRVLLGQRHLAPVLDPVGFAAAILDFTTAIDGTGTGTAGVTAQPAQNPKMSARASWK